MNAHLVLFISRFESREGALDNERGELLSVDFCENDVEVRKSTVRNPHFLAVQDVVRAFRIQFRARQGVLRVRAGLRLGKAISAYPLSGRQLRQVLLLLLLISEIHDGQRSDAGVSAVRHRESTVDRQLFGEHRRSNLVEARTSVLLRYTPAQ